MRVPFGVANAAGALWGAPGPWTLRAIGISALLLTVAAVVRLPPPRRLLSDKVWARTED
ncbi:hypothetical protein ACFUIW_01755 [Streptomyces sp. NPDC057245]|uniref:hypothetical protein n=1 Tax=Streptomyces TaxID=1883 RepID=UPI001C1E7415|nr:hypothetical protein [Streptomyces sp. A108]MBU6529722.1 hypothetical protein [Streptomyces sp. A108]